MYPHPDRIERGDILNARTEVRLGQAIRRLRVRRKLTQAQLAERAGVSRQWIVTVEKGVTPGPAISHIMRVLDALDATLTVRDDAGEPLSVIPAGRVIGQVERTRNNVTQFTYDDDAMATGSAPSEP